jgi:hypothetical protein
VSKPISNIILHLKCTINDLTLYNDDYNKQVTNPLNYNPSIPPQIQTYDTINEQFSVYNNGETESVAVSAEADMAVNKFAYVDSADTYNRMSSNTLTASSGVCKTCNSAMAAAEDSNAAEKKSEDDDVDLKDIYVKLKKLKISLYKGGSPEKKSACFWCTYNFDNPECYIPKYEMDDTLYVYGSFCRPECAVAYLMKENIDDSTKFERYHLLNMIYSKIYNYTKNIKPAPNPHYLLDKFYGNMTIQEYRRLLKTEHLLLVIEKPLTRILPELHEDNENFIINMYGSSANRDATTTSGVGMYKVKRQSEKQTKVNKNNIVKSQFGITCS